MTKKLNGMVKWIIVGLAVSGLVFNSGVTYNHINQLSKDVTELKESYEKIDEKIDTIMVTIAAM